MGKLKIVLFSESGARILVNPENPDQYKNCSNAMINPNLEQVRGIPPHLWDLQEGQVVPLPEEMHDIREQHVMGANKIPAPRPVLWRKLLPLVYALIGAGLAQAISAYF
jgi:hypothetical protein